MAEATEGLSYASGGPGRDPAHPNLYAALLETVAQRGDEPAIRSEHGDRDLTWNQLRARVDRLAGGLAALGVGKGDRIALLMHGRPEFIPIDLAATALGAVPFSIYTTSSAEQIRHLITDSGARIAFVDLDLAKAFLAVEPELPQLEQVIALAGADPQAPRPPGSEAWLSPEELAESAPDFDPGPLAAAVGPDDLLTLIYTSGTTGPPKGVQLSHGNIGSLLASVEDLIDFPAEGGRVISWLPAAHIAERAANYYLPVMRGWEVTVCPDPRRIIEFLPRVRPTWFFAVPRIFEKLKAGLETQLAGLDPEQRRPLEDGLRAATERVRLQQRGEAVPAAIDSAADAADQQIFSGLRSMLGLDQAVAVNVGAAPTPVEVLEFFHAIGIPVGELWGMSETCGGGTLNPPGRTKLGTVGPPVPGVEIKLAEDGEVLIRGDNVMAGYRNLPELTAATLDDQRWLATGDVGRFDEDGYLSIIDRKKELIITAGGKNISPSNIESLLKAASPLIGQACVIGDQRPFVSALIVIDPDFGPVWAAQQDLDGADPARLAGEPRLIEAIQAAVDAANAKLARAEQVRRFRVLPCEWPPGGEELTPTMKLKRLPIADKYSEEIEDLYS